MHHPMFFKGGWDTRFSRSQEHGSVWGSGVAERKRGPSASSQTAREEGPPGKSPAWKGTRFLRFLPGEALRGFSPCVPGRGTRSRGGDGEGAAPEGAAEPLGASPHFPKRRKRQRPRARISLRAFLFSLFLFFLFFSIFFF